MTLGGAHMSTRMTCTDEANRSEPYGIGAWWSQ